MSVCLTSPLHLSTLQIALALSLSSLSFYLNPFIDRILSHRHTHSYKLRTSIATHSFALSRLSWNLPRRNSNKQKKVLNNVAKHFGTVVHQAKHEYDDADVSYCYVGVVVNDGRRIQGEVSVLWRDNVHGLGHRRLRRLDSGFLEY